MTYYCSNTQKNVNKSLLIILKKFLNLRRQKMAINIFQYIEKEEEPLIILCKR